MAHKRVILGVSGSIASYKSVYLLRLLRKAEVEVKVIVTESVLKFVGELSFSSLSNQQVFRDVWSEGWSEHVHLGNWADLFVIAPATAQTISKLAHGNCDNALTAVYLSAKCPVMVAPAMDADMYLHPRVQANLEILKKDGVNVLPTGVGFLASGLEGPGRMLEPEDIFRHIKESWEPGMLHGKKILISAGPTREAIDPVRFISNYSSGKMGYALADAAKFLGAKVTLVSGPTAISPPQGVRTISVESGKQMLDAMIEHADHQDVIIMAAAVSDYAPSNISPQKIKKNDDTLSISFNKTKDILFSLGQQKKDHQILVGFALETNDEISNAQKKLSKKQLDLIVLNSLQDKGAGFGYDTNKITIIDKKGNVYPYPLKAKREVAMDILYKISTLLNKM